MEELIKQMYFEDVEIGQEAESVGRTITEADIVNFACMTGDFNTIHTDAEYAKTVNGERVAHGLLAYAVACGLYTRTAYNLAIMKSLKVMTGVDMKFKKPVHIGDTIHVVQKVVDKQDPRPESDCGKVTFAREVINQNGEVVTVATLSQLIKKRGK